MVELTIEEKGILKNLKTFYDPKYFKKEELIGNSTILQEKLEEAFRGGIAQQEEAEGTIIGVDYLGSLVFTKRNLDGVLVQGKAFGIFLRGFKFPTFWKRLITNDKNKNILKLTLALLKDNGFNTEVFNAVVEANLQNHLRKAYSTIKETDEDYLDNYIYQIHQIEQMFNAR
jgi:hypothetical protein